MTKPLWLSLVITLLLTVVAPVRADIAIIVSRDCQTEAVSQEDLKRIFNGKLKKLPSSSNVLSVFDHPDDSSLYARFYASLFGIDAKRMNRRRAAYLFSGQGVIPAVVRDEHAMKASVSSDSSSIGYIDAGSVDDSVRVLLILPEAASLP